VTKAVKPPKASEFENWENVDGGGLRRMGEIKIKLGKLEGEMTLKINEIKSDYDTRAEGLKAEYKSIEDQITLFAEERKGEFAKNRTKNLTFGVVAYRVTSKVVIRSKAACLAAMRALGLTQYIRTTEEPDKEAMSGLDAAVLAKVGAVLKTEDKPRIEPNIEKIREAV
jgi:phage host-nuclease inhibitor protein Gam